MHTARGREDAWKARWRHIPLVDKNCLSSPPCDMMYVRCPEELPYQSRLAGFVRTLKSVSAVPPVSLDLCFFDRPFDNLYWLRRRARWAEDSSNDCRLRQRPRDNFCPMWHQVEFHDVLPAHRGKYYPKLPDNWNEFEVHNGLCVPTPPVFAYSAWVMLASPNPLARAAIPNVFLVEWVVQAIMAFVDAAYAGVRAYVRVGDARLYDSPDSSVPRGRLFRLPQGVIRTARRLGLESMLQDCETDAGLVEQLLATVEGLPWNQVPAEGYVWYDWDSHTIVTMPSRSEYPLPDITSGRVWEQYFGEGARGAGYSLVASEPAAVEGHSGWQMALDEETPGIAVGVPSASPVQQSSARYLPPESTRSSALDTPQKTPSAIPVAPMSDKPPSESRDVPPVSTEEPFGKTNVPVVILDSDDEGRGDEDNIGIPFKKEDRAVGSGSSGDPTSTKAWDAFVSACRRRGLDVPANIVDALITSSFVVEECHQIRAERDRLQTEAKELQTKLAAAESSVAQLQVSVSQYKAALQSVSQSLQLASQLSQQAVAAVNNASTAATQTVGASTFTPTGSPTGDTVRPRAAKRPRRG